jgi:DNA invertase Pin-like site-specific DNA recombinase
MTAANPIAKRCAIYTRKSSEEGLEQDFNSLQAQRESCEAFIKSQKTEGWRLVETAFDDGGFSGGTMERPALQRLLADIRAKRIDVVVVYKIDRLTRALTDFAKMVEVFDTNGVSFVAVTQQFNTTTSMGRLTLNVLLSFAQFEREVTAERIRDKIAASKKKGMWMGGNVPLGYDVQDRQLVINAPEAETVRDIFRRYLELKCVRRLAEDLKQAGVRSKVRNGQRKGGTTLVRGALYTMLANPIYTGEIRHGKLTYPGLHEAIIDRDLWDQVQKMLAGNGVTRAERPMVSAPSPLAGKLFDENGERLTPSHTVKKGRRYRYYVSRALTVGTADADKRCWRLPAPDLEQAVAQAIRGILADRTQISTTLSAAGIATAALQSCLSRAKALIHSDGDAPLFDSLRRVEIAETGLTMTLSLAAIVVADTQNVDPDALVIIRTVPMSIRRRGVEMRLIIASDTSASPADPALIKAIARSRKWFDELATGAMSSITAIAQREGVTDTYIGSLLPLAFLAPAIVEAIIAGDQPPDLTAETLLKRIDLPTGWAEQGALLGFA